MFFIEEHGSGGSWKIVQVQDPRHSSYRFMRAYGSHEEAERVMMTQYYEWPEEMVRFAIENNLPWDYHGVKKEMKKRG